MRDEMLFKQTLRWKTNVPLQTIPEAAAQEPFFTCNSCNGIETQKKLELLSYQEIADIFTKVVVFQWN